mgnify:CR=1 FL=1
MFLKKNSIFKRITMVFIAISVIASIFLIPLGNAFALITGNAVTRGAYFDLPEAVEKYATSGKTLEFDLNVKLTGEDKLNFRLTDSDNDYVSSSFSVGVAPTSRSITLST